MPHPLRTVVLGLGAHWVLCDLLGSSWWAPDLTVLALMLAIGDSPDDWPLPAVLVGGLTMAWAVPAPAAVGLWFVAAGAALALLAKRFDLTALRIQLLIVGLAEACWIVLHAWLGDMRPLSVLGPALLRIGLTVAFVPAGRKLLTGR